MSLKFKVLCALTLLLNYSISMDMIKLPCPSSISFFWNFGSLLSMALMIQIISGLFLTMHYTPDISLAFESIMSIEMDVNNGWLVRYIHTNGATLFFIFIYLHISRGLYYKSFYFQLTWSIGVTIYLLFMMVAFMGYVLPWGQMSYWGATVITNLISAIPYWGASLVEWVWGGFSVSNPTLGRFFAIHFIMPFVGLTLSMIHLMFLHKTGSSNPLGLAMNADKLSFHPFFTIKDLLGVGFAMMVYTVLSFQYPYMCMDPDNWVEANPMSTPAHIQPEWYFLFAYAILRSIPSKLGGVIALLMSITILYFLTTKKNMNGPHSHFLYRVSLMMFFFLFIMLTWIGMLPVEAPYLLYGKLFSSLYFIVFFILLLI